MTERKVIEEKVKANLETVLSSGFVPSLGTHIKGKVRDVHFTENKIIGVTSDRVSAFDSNLSRDIPFKGRVINGFSDWAMDVCEEVMPNARIQSPDQNVVVQDKYDNLGFECIVRGFVWGSMAGGYESGKKEICGITLEDGLLRYQKLDTPLFTPTTKAEKGQHDENVSMEFMVKALTDKYGPEHGPKLANQAKTFAMALYQKQAEATEEKGILFLDTKYEFGVRKTERGYELVLIDEAGTPDSSRFCDVAEYETKWPKIQEVMASGNYKTVTAMLNDNPELKITEMSKQFLRDVLVARAEAEGKKQVTEITDEDAVETAVRYIELYERLTGNDFDFGNESVPIGQRVVGNLINAGYTNGGTVVIMAGSDSDKPWMKKIYEGCAKYGVAAIPRVASAHKQPEKLLEMVEEYNSSIEPIIIAGVAGGTDALSGTAAWHSMWPVVSCPPKESACIEAVVSNPPGSSNAYVARADNLGRFAAQAFGAINPEYHKKIAEANQGKVTKLLAADAVCQSGDFFNK